MAGYVAPREFSFCQHVVSGNDGAGQVVSTNTEHSLAGGGEGVYGAAALTKAVDPGTEIAAMAQNGNRRAAKWLEGLGDFQVRCLVLPSDHLAGTSTSLMCAAANGRVGENGSWSGEC